MFKQSSPRGSAKLAPDLTAVDGHILEDKGGGRSGHRKDAVGAAYLTAAYVYGRVQLRKTAS